MTGRALVVVDMIQTYEHADAEALRESAAEAVPVLRELLARARAAGAPVIYVNDVAGDWRGDRGTLIAGALDGPHAGLVEPIVPDDDAMLLYKARHSIFYETSLEYLLRTGGIESIVLAGQVTEQCILYSALDAHIRHIPVVVPRDACADIHADLAQAALRMMELNMDVTVCDAADVRFEAPAAAPA